MRVGSCDGVKSVQSHRMAGFSMLMGVDSANPSHRQLVRQNSVFLPVWNFRTSPNNPIDKTHQQISVKFKFMIDTANVCR